MHGRALILRRADAARHPALRTRGAAFLLAVYLSALTLLLLGGVSLQRVSVNMQSARVSRDLQQAYALAEAGLDEALVALETAASLPDNTVYQRTTPVGSYTYQVTTLSNQIQPGGTQQLIRRVTATGVAGGRTAVAHVITRSDRTLSGILANGTLETIVNDWTQHPFGVRIDGNLLSTAGLIATFTLDDGTEVTRDVVIGPKDPRPGLGYQTPISSWLGDKPGILAGDGDEYDGLDAATTEGTITQQATAPLQPADLSSLCQPAVTAPLILYEHEQLHIRDGDSLDRSPVKDQIVVCASHVLLDMNTTLAFHDPALLYVTSRPHPQRPPSYDGNSFDNYALGNFGRIRVMGRAGLAPDRGLTIVAPILPSGTVEAASLYPGDLEGSVYAPESSIEMSTSDHEMALDCDDCEYEHHPSTRQTGFIAGKEIIIDGVPIDARRHGSQTEPIKTQTSTAAWMAGSGSSP